MKTYVIEAQITQLIQTRAAVIIEAESQDDAQDQAEVLAQATYDDSDIEDFTVLRGLEGQDLKVMP